MADDDLFLVGRLFWGMGGDLDDFVLFDPPGGIEAEVAVHGDSSAFDSAPSLVPGEFRRPAAKERGEGLACFVWRDVAGGIGHGRY